MLKGDRATPYLVGFKGHESAKIFYADANARYPYRTAGLYYCPHLYRLPRAKSRRLYWVARGPGLRHQCWKTDVSEPNWSTEEKVGTKAGSGMHWTWPSSHVKWKPIDLNDPSGSRWNVVGWKEWRREYFSCVIAEATWATAPAEWDEAEVVRCSGLTETRRCMCAGELNCGRGTGQCQRCQHLSSTSSQAGHVHHDVSPTVNTIASVYLVLFPASCTTTRFCFNDLFSPEPWLSSLPLVFLFQLFWSRTQERWVTRFGRLSCRPADSVKALNELRELISASEDQPLPHASPDCSWKWRWRKGRCCPILVPCSVLVSIHEPNSSQSSLRGSHSVLTFIYWKLQFSC